MVLNNVGGFQNITEYVQDKTKRYQKENKSFETLFRYMFSEEKNVMAELSDGYRIKKITYGEARERIFSIAPTISKQLSFVPQDSIVGLYMANSMEWIEIFWAMLMCGYRPLLMNSRLSDETLEKAISDYDVKAVISDSVSFSVPSFMASEIFDAEQDSESFAAKWADEIIFMSSGTSDNVKLCFYTGENLFYQVCDSANIIESCPQIKEHYEGELKQLALLPFYHVFGFIAVYIWFGFYSRTFVFLKDLRPQTLLNTIKKHKVTHIFAVPLVWDTIYKTALKTIRVRGEKTYKKFRKALKIVNSTGSFGQIFAKKALREVRDNLFGDSIKFMISGGSSISPEVLEFFNGIGYHLVNGYGMTEIGITSVERSSNIKIINSATIGTPFSQTQYKLNENGELLIKSKTRASKIAVDNVETITDYNEYFNTHDLVKLKNGRYYIFGRKDDLIVCENGENLNPVITERLLNIIGSASLCIFNDRNTPTLIISAPNCFTAEQYDTIHASAIEALRNAKIDNLIKHIVITPDSLLQENDFKISRNKISKRFAQGRYTILDPQDSVAFDKKLSALETEIRDMFAEVLKRPSDKIDAKANFFSDLGGTSLDYFALMDMIKSRFDTALPMNDGKSLSTVEELCHYLKAKR